MSTDRRSGEDTRTSLLDSACVVFAQKGYRNATIAEICERAKANIAAVNYHFGGKETLYVEAWRVAFHRSMARRAPDGGVPASAPPEERLRGRVRALIQRFLDPENYEFQMVHKELATPTGLLAEVMRESIGPMRKAMADIVRELLGPAASECDVHLCQMSIGAQCLHPMIRERHRKIFGEQAACQDCTCEQKREPSDPGVEAMIDHVVAFSLAGIRHVREEIEAGHRPTTRGRSHAK